MIASYTGVLPLFDYPIGLRPENPFASGEPFYIRRTFLRRLPSESLVASGSSGRHGPLSTCTQ